MNPDPGCSRRALLQAMLVSASAGATLARPLRLMAAQGLGDIAASRGLLFGSCIRGTLLTGDPDYAVMVASQCRLIVSALEMHWDVVEPKLGRYDFHEADDVAAWAQTFHQKLRGHALVWHERAPGWFADLPDRAAAVQALQDHVRASCSHFAGRIHSWDVVNEALQPRSGLPGDLRDTVFARKIGPDFLDIAFHAARESDPKALLSYNEFDVELDLPWHEEKRRALLRLLDGFRKRGTPIDAIGLQSHLRTETIAGFDPRTFGRFLDEIAARGVRIMLTELDVADRSAPSDIARRDRAVADAYARYLDAALANRAVSTVITWSLTDRDSWVTRGDLPAFRRSDGLAPRPLPFDAEYRPKPAFTAIADALRRAPQR